MCIKALSQKINGYLFDKSDHSYTIMPMFAWERVKAKRDGKSLKECGNENN
jgi:hypothetical protein